MSNSAIKSSHDPRILSSVADEGDRTVLSVWKDAVPSIVQEEIDGYELAEGELSKSFHFLSFHLYPQLSNLFKFAHKLNDIFQSSYNVHKSQPRVTVSLPGAKAPPSADLHCDLFSGKARKDKINMLCVMRASHSLNGKFRYVDRGEAGKDLVSLGITDFGYARAEYFDCRNAQVIRYAPINSVVSFLCDGEEGLVHSSSETQGGARWKISIERGLGL